MQNKWDREWGLKNEIFLPYLGPAVLDVYQTEICSHLADIGLKPYEATQDYSQHFIFQHLDMQYGADNKGLGL